MNKLARILSLSLFLVLGLTGCHHGMGEGTTVTRGGYSVTIQGGRLVLSDSIHFETDSDALAAGSTDFLDLISEVLRTHSGIANVRIEGHTDAHGAADHNHDLSERRARTVAAYLTAHGVTQPITAAGFGSAQAVCSEATEACDARNRRVDFFIGED